MMNLKERGYGHGKWMKLAHDRVQLQDMVLVVLNLQVPLSVAILLIAQAISCQLLTVEAQVQAHVEFVVDRVALG
jgi:hypothetical protein